MSKVLSHIPLIDVGALVHSTNKRNTVATQIGRACRSDGFFYIVNHGVEQIMIDELEDQSRKFFKQDPAKKMQISMEKAGTAWRGYFPVGQELTSGQADLKEGIYFGSELSPDHPSVRAAIPLHGPNLFPPDLPHLRPLVLGYMSALTKLGHTLMRGLSLSLGLDEDYFAQLYTSEPFILFRIFSYPPASKSSDSKWGVGEHTDYGILTILRQDNCGGLEIKSRSGWIQAPPINGSFICNIGDMLDRMTRGLYRSTAHRVVNRTNKTRLALPFFFDPNFNAQIKPIPLGKDITFSDDKNERWDHESVHGFEGTYGEYLVKKVSRVFPNLAPIRQKMG